MKNLLIITGLIEIATGVALLVAPVLVGRWLLGAELVGVSVVVARVAGIALLGLGVGSWPGPASLGMFTYNALGTGYFTWLALGGKWAGPLLWPAAVLHGCLAILFGIVWFRNQRPTAARPDQLNKK